MPADIHQIITLFVFFLGVALCFWRFPHADRWHVGLCLVAAGLWVGLLFFEPQTRTVIFGVSTVMWLVTALTQPFRRPGTHVRL